MLSTEQGVYISEFVTGNNQKQAKGRFRVYENDNGSVNVSIFIHVFCLLLLFTEVFKEHCLLCVQDKAISHSVKRESSTAGRKDGTKSTKKAGKSLFKSVNY